MISVVVATKNRPEHIVSCVTSIMKSTYPQYEVIVIDQTVYPNLTLKKLSAENKKIKYITTERGGKALALNRGIHKARGSFFAFTDDDCVVDKNWLEEIQRFLVSHPNAMGVFGNTRPFKRPSQPDMVCPATFDANRVTSFRSPNVLHYAHIGQGNNMAFRASVFKKIGLFEGWLGPGSIGLVGGEDSEFIFRALARRATLMTDPKMIVYHNRWITKRQERILQGYYTYGLTTAFGYYMPTSLHKTALSLSIRRLRERCAPEWTQMKFHAAWFLKNISYILYEICASVAGFAVGIVFGVVHHIKKTHPFRHQQH